MSRSKKKTPIMGIASDSDARYEKYLHGKRRAKVRELLSHGDFDGAEVELPYDGMDSCKDGKQWFNALFHPEWLRK